MGSCDDILACQPGDQFLDIFLFRDIRHDTEQGGFFGRLLQVRLGQHAPHIESLLLC